MDKKEVDVIFLDGRTLIPRGLDPSWYIMHEYWAEFKILLAEDLTGSTLIYEGKAIGGVRNSSMKTKRKILDMLRAQGLEPHILEQSPF